MKKQQLKNVSPVLGFEPATSTSRSECSTTELLRTIKYTYILFKLNHTAANGVLLNFTTAIGPRIIYTVADAIRFETVEI